jgi:hypothetical protein
MKPVSLPIGIADVTIDAIAHIQTVATQAGVYAERAPTRLDRLHEVVIPVPADLEEDPVLGFTMGRPAGVPPCRECPAYVTLHSGATREQERLAYAYLAASLLVDGRGCSVPLPPSTVAALHALPDDDRECWLRALALLVPPDGDWTGLSVAEAARLLLIPESLLEFYVAAM